MAVLILALLVAIVWLLRLRRRAKLNPVDAHMVVCGMVGALAIGLFGAFAILLIHLPPDPIAILFSCFAGAGPAPAPPAWDRTQRPARRIAAIRARPGKTAGWKLS